MKVRFVIFSLLVGLQTYSNEIVGFRAQNAAVSGDFQTMGKSSNDVVVADIRNRFSKGIVPTAAVLLGHWRCTEYLAIGNEIDTERWNMSVTEDYSDESVRMGTRIFDKVRNLGWVSSNSYNYGGLELPNIFTMRHDATTDSLLLEFSAKYHPLLIFQDLISDRSLVHNDYYVLTYVRCHRY